MSELKNVVMFKPEMSYGVAPGDDSLEIPSIPADSEQLKPCKGERINLISFRFVCPCCDASFICEYWENDEHRKHK